MNAVSHLFRGHAIPPPPTQAQIDSALDNFADLLSLDLPLSEIAARMSVSGGTCCVLLRMLCERYGERAQ